MEELTALLNLKDAAKFLNVSAPTLLRMLADPELKLRFVDLGAGPRKRRIRFDPNELAAWIASRTKSTGEPPKIQKMSRPRVATKKPDMRVAQVVKNSNGAEVGHASCEQVVPISPAALRALMNGDQ